MIASLVIAVAASSFAWLHDEVPGGLLRERSLEVQWTSGANGGCDGLLETPASRVVFLRHPRAASMPPLVARTSSAGGRIERTIPWDAQGEGLVFAQLPLELSPLSEEPTSTEWLVRTNSACSTLRPTLAALTLRRDEFAIAGGAQWLRSMAMDGLEAKAVDQIVHGALPHRWQEAIARDVLALKRLSSKGLATRELTMGLVEWDIANARTDDPTFVVPTPIPTLGAEIDPGDHAMTPWQKLPSNAEIVIPVADQESVRVVTRTIAPGPMTTRYSIEAAFDTGERTIELVASRPDRDVPEYGRPRGADWVVPPGAKTLRLKVVGASIAIRGFTVRHRRWLEEATGSEDAASWFAKAAAPGRNAGTFARAQLGLGSWESARRLVADDPALAAWVSSFALRRAGVEGLAECAALLARLDADEMQEDALARLVTPAILREQARIFLLSGRYREAAEARAALISSNRATMEDLIEFGMVEATASGDDGSASRSLAGLEASAQSRPMDFELAWSFARTFHLSSRWTSLKTTSTAPFVSIAATRAESEPGQLPSPSPGGWAAVTSSGVWVDVRQAAMPGHRPVMSLFVARASTSPVVLDVWIDDQLSRIPLLDGRGRFDLPVSSGRHLIRVGPQVVDGRVLVNHAVEPAVSSRRYSVLGNDGLSFQTRAVTSRSFVELDVRWLGPFAGAPRAKLRVTGADGETVDLFVDGLRASNDDVIEGESVAFVSEPIVSTFSLATDGQPISITPVDMPPSSRLAVHLSIRRPSLGAETVETERSTALSALAADADPLAVIARWSAAIASKPEALELRLQRASALADLDEILLAREDLAAVLDSESAGPRLRTWANEFRAALDSISGAHPLSMPGSRSWAMPELAVAAPGAIGPSLLALLDAGPPAAGELADWVSRASGPAEADLMLVWVGRHGADVVAAEAWDLLASRHANVSVLQRESGAAWLSSSASDGAARAFARLSEAVRLEPRDSLAHRLLRRARAATEAVPNAVGEGHAGTVRALVSRTRTRSVSTLEESMTPRPDGEVEFIGSAGWSMDVALSEPLQIPVRATFIELRPSQALDSLAQRVSLSLWIDGEARSIACEQVCVGTLDLTPGPHRVEARWVGGVRPAGWFDVAGLRSRYETAHAMDWSVARAESPWVLRVRGPTVLTVEMRTRLDRRAASKAIVKVSDQTEVALSTNADPLGQLEGGTRLGESVNLPVFVPPGVDRIEIRPDKGDLLLRASVRKSRIERPEEETTTAVRRAEGSLVWTVPSWPMPAVTMGDVTPGLDRLGDLSVSSRFMRRSLHPVGLENQPVSQGVVQVLYRRAWDSMPLVTKVGAEGRYSPTFGTSGWFGGELFFRRPEQRRLRLLWTFDGYAQSAGGNAEGSVRTGLMVEPIVALRPGLSLVNKASVWISARTLTGMPDSQLVNIDPDVFSRYDLNHPRGLTLESGIQWTPFANLVTYGAAKLTTNPGFSPLDQDHVSALWLARALFGKTFVQAQFRGTWFFVDAARADPAFVPVASVSAFQTVWAGARHRFEYGASTNVRLDEARYDLFAYLSWSFSNGRRFLDYTPLEAEDYFFPQRGPGAERARVGAPLDR